MTRIVRPFNIMAKPVCGVCNLACRYCYYSTKPSDLYPGVDQFRMTDEVLDSYTRQYLDCQPERCQFGWQGGEPTLAGLEFFQRAVALQKQYARPGQEVSNAIQTNGTLLDRRWCEFFVANNFLVGISIDGPAQWHDAFRRDRAGEPTFSRAWAAMEMLGDCGVEFNVLVTLNSVNAPHAGDIYRYFVNRGVRYLQFIPILEYGPDGTVADFSCTARQFGRFMLDVFEIWSTRDVGRVSERFIDNCLHQVLFDSASMCCYARRCGNSHVLEFNGDLYACDHFVLRQWLIGNLLQRPLAELVTDEKLDRFERLKTDLPDACRDCEFLEFCNAGCPLHHQPVGTDPARVNYFCQGYKMFFSRALPELRRIAESFRQSVGSGSARPGSARPGSDQIGSARPGSDQAGGVSPGPMAATGGARPGRNDPCPCGSGRKYKNCCGPAR